MPMQTVYTHTHTHSQVPGSFIVKSEEDTEFFSLLDRLRLSDFHCSRKTRSLRNRTAALLQTISGNTVDQIVLDYFPSDKF